MQQRRKQNCLVNRTGSQMPDSLFPALDEFEKSLIAYVPETLEKSHHDIFFILILHLSRRFHSYFILVAIADA
jgi:hypothetical protein